MKTGKGYIINKILPEFACILQRFGGEVDLPLLMDGTMELLKEPNFRPEYTFLIDFRGTDFRLSPEDILEFTSAIRDSDFASKPRKSAYLIQGSQQKYLSLLYKQSRKSLSIDGRVCRDVREMCTWSGVRISPEEVKNWFEQSENNK